MSYNDLDAAGDTWGQFTWILHCIATLYEKSTHPHIKCTQCTRHFEAHEWNGKIYLQAADCCAWSLYKDGRWFVHCGYGSDYDLHEFAYTRDFPTAKQDPICDYCIERMMHSGQLAHVQIQTLEYDEPFNETMLEYLEHS